MQHINVSELVILLLCNICTFEISFKKVNVFSIYLPDFFHPCSLFYDKLQTNSFEICDKVHAFSKKLRTYYKINFVQYYSKFSYKIEIFAKI